MFRQYVLTLFYKLCKSLYSIVLMAASQDKQPTKMPLDQIIKTTFVKRSSKTVHKELMNEIIKG